MLKVKKKTPNIFSRRYDFQQRSQPLQRFHEYLMAGRKKIQSKKKKHTHTGETQKFV